MIRLSCAVATISALATPAADAQERVTAAQVDSATGTLRMTETEGPRVVERIMLDGDDARHEAIFAGWTPPSSDRGPAEGVIERLEFHPELPMIGALMATWDGALWVLRTPEDGFHWETDEAAALLPVGPDLLRLHRDPSVIDVIGRDGRYLGTFPAGEARWPVAFGPGGLAAYVELNDLDVPTVVVRRLPDAVR